MSFWILGTDWYTRGCRDPAPLGQQEFKKDREKTYADRQYSPKQALPGRWNRVGFNLVRGRHIILRPRGNLTASESLDFSISDKCQQRLVIRVVDKNVFQAVAIGVFQHGSQGCHACRTVKLRIGELRRTVVSHLR